MNTALSNKYGPNTILSSAAGFLFSNNRLTLKAPRAGQVLGRGLCDFHVAKTLPGVRHEGYSGPTCGHLKFGKKKGKGAGTKYVDPAVTTSPGGTKKATSLNLL